MVKSIRQLDAAEIASLEPNSYELASYYAMKGFQVFPVGNKNKKPNNGFQWKDYATTDLNLIKGYWTTGGHAGAAVGIACGIESDLLVIDIDNKNGKDGSNNIKKIVTELNLVINTFTALTPSGGFHLYFTFEDCGFTSHVDVYEGIDLKGEGGYVVAAGSLINGGLYNAYK